MPAGTAKRAGLLLLGVALAISAFRPYDRTTWLLEVFPVIVGVPLLLWFERSAGVTRLLFMLIVLHGLVLIWGGAYTYARAPLGFWMQDWFGFERNHYDRIGHFMQGFVPALIAREVLIRSARAVKQRYLALLCVCVSLAVSASYELIEWAAALVLGQGAEEFLGTQGDPWDTQSDMLLALLGAVTSLLLLASRHDRELAALR